MSALATYLLSGGLFALFLSRRVLTDGVTGTGLFWLGLAAVVGSAIWRGAEMSSAKSASKRVEKWLLVAHGGVLLGLAMYALTTEWGMETLGVTESSESIVLLAVLWPAMLGVAYLALLFMEFAYRKMPVAESVELRRVWASGLDGLAIGLALVFAVSINYVAKQRDVREDLSYFKTAMPSESTVSMVKKLGEPIEAVLFYPTANDVLLKAKPFFDQLGAASDKFKVRVVDHALAPKLAKKHNVRRNGVVLLLKGEGETQQGKSFEVGTELAAARGKLKTLDERFQENFTKLTKQRREIHFTVGHDERSDASYTQGQPGESTRELRKALTRANVTVRDLGLEQGLAEKVPEAAPAVFVAGPRKSFLPEEARSLLDYVRKGGRLVVMIDPSDPHGLEPLLEGLGVTMHEGVLTSDKKYIPRTRTDADRTNVFSNSFSSHPTVTLASRAGGRAVAVFLAGGALDRKNGKEAPGTKVVFPIRGPSDAWLDLDGDYQKGPEEKRQTYNMMAAVTVAPSGAQGEGAEKNEGRAVIIADADFASDQVISHPMFANVAVINDMLIWLLGEEEVVGAPTSEEDVPIQHTREEDKLWFYGTTLGIPLPLFALGAWVATRRKRRRKPTGRDPQADVKTPDEDQVENKEAA